MKILTLFLGLAIGCGIAANAQSRLAAGLTFAPYSSYNGKSLDIDVPFRYSVGVAVGAQAQFNLTSKWSLSSGLWYERASVKTGTDFYGTASVTSQRYLTIPLWLNFRLNERKVAPYFTAGLLMTKIMAERGLTTRPHLAAGLSYRMIPELTLNLQPAFTIGANSKSESLLTSTNRQLSLQAQLLYNFGSIKQNAIP